MTTEHVPGPTWTLGIDLASQPSDTAACLIEWSAGRALAERYEGRLDDEQLVELIREPKIEKVAIDAPFGWPDEFVEAVSAWSESGSWPITLLEREEKQPRLILRETDRRVLEVTAEPFEAETESRRAKRPLR